MTEKIFLNLKLKCLLPTEVYKVADILFACQKDGYVTYSSNNVKSMHMPKEVVEIAIQTLIDRQILDQPVKEGNFWKFKINADSIKRYQDSSWDDINEAPALRKSSELKFTHQESVALEESDVIENMSTQQMMRMMRVLSARIKEEQSKQEMMNNDASTLPY